MELKEYAAVIREEKKLIVRLTLLTLLFSLLFSLALPVRFETSVSLFLSKKDSQPTDEFKYDGYYALEAAESMAEHIEKTLQSPEVVDAIYQKSGIDPQFKNLKSYKKKFTAHKMSNQYVEVSFTSARREDAAKLSQAMVATVNEKLAAISSGSGQEVSFSVSNSQPVTLEKRTDPVQSALLGLLSGFLLGLFAAFLRKYLS
jgi:capsular polysaccharide biosynthesis protein